MKKKVMKYVAAVMLLFVFVLASPLKGQKVEAAGPKDVPKKNTINHIYCPKGGDLENTLYMWPTEEKGWTITKVSCKNTKVAAVKKFNDEQYGDSIVIKSKKAGSTTIKFTLKKGSKSYNYTWNLKVRKYENPFKTLKIGSKSYASKFNNTYAPTLNKKISGKFTYTLKSGWKIERIKKFTGPGNGKTVKKNQKLTLNKGDGLLMWVKNKKTGVATIFELGIF